MATIEFTEKRDIAPVNIVEEMKRSYLDYAMSVIVSRAVPDVRDGLKPVHRRILFSMYEGGLDYNKPYRKSARIVGDVIGKYHPHGEMAIYESLVRMAQNFSVRVTLVDGQGNFGSIDGDSAAAMRYTESRLSKITHKLLDDLDKDTVDYVPNYDGSENEPTVLPAMFPNLLVNGSGGIAVGMATNIPPHNLGEVLDACCLYVDQNDVTIEELNAIVKGPDFPTAGMILGTTGIKSAYATGRGSILMRGRTNIEKLGNREAIIITEIPYQVNKARLVERIAELVNEKKIEGISDLRDESNKEGIRVVVELKKDVMADVILNQLYVYTPLQTSFGVNALALNDGRPEIMNLKDIIVNFVRFREIVITRRTSYLLGKARDRAHILIGLSMAVANIDEVIALIKASKNAAEAKDSLMARPWVAGDILPLIELVGDRGNHVKDGKCYFTEEQAKAILEMRLQRLTGLEQEKIRNDLNDIAAEIRSYIEILGSREKLLSILKEELLKVKEDFATPRLTEIVPAEGEFDIEELIQKEDMVVTVTHEGYIKRVPLSTYKAQRRGGKGRSAVKMKEEDVTTEMFISNTHTPILYFSNMGKVYKLKVYKLPLGNPQSRGRALVNLLPLAPNEKITNVMPLPENEADWDNLNIMFATATGQVRRNDFSDFHDIRSNGKIAIKLDDNDSLIGVALCKEKDHVLIAAKSGKALRFPVEAVRVFKSRTSSGVIGIRMANDDRLISMSILHGAEIDQEVKDEYLKIPVEIRNAISYSETDEEALAHAARANSSLGTDRVIDLARNEEFILTVTENGYGKRSSAYEYRITNRGGSGIINIITAGKNGGVVASLPVDQTDQIMIVTDKGVMLRSAVANIKVQGRNTKGVKIQRTDEDEFVVSVARIADTGVGNEDEEGEEMGEASEDNE